MRLSANYRIALVNELRTVADLMSKAKTAQEKNYYFSAIFGIANRIMNFEFDPELAFLHNVINHAHTTLHGNLLMVAQGQSVSTFPPPVFDKLQEAVVELASLIEKKKATYPVLEKISNLAYSTTGNGYYLFLKGSLKIV